MRIAHEPSLLAIGPESSTVVLGGDGSGVYKNVTVCSRPEPGVVVLFSSLLELFDYDKSGQP